MKRTSEKSVTVTRTKKAAASHTITLRPETYRRLEELATLANEDVSDYADGMLTCYLDEEDELHEEQERRIRLGLCLFCGKKACRGECTGIDLSALRPALLTPPID